MEASNFLQFIKLAIRKSKKYLICELINYYCTGEITGKNHFFTISNGISRDSSIFLLVISSTLSFEFWIEVPEFSSLYCWISPRIRLLSCFFVLNVLFCRSFSSRSKKELKSSIGSWFVVLDISPQINKKWNTTANASARHGAG